MERHITCHGPLGTKRLQFVPELPFVVLLPLGVPFDGPDPLVHEAHELRGGELVVGELLVRPQLGVVALEKQLVIKIIGRVILLLPVCAEMLHNNGAFFATNEANEKTFSYINIDIKHTHIHTLWHSKLTSSSARISFSLSQVK